MWRSVGALGLVMATMACAGTSESTASSSARVEGTVVQRSLDNARAIAITPDGHRTWSYLDVRGHFALELPTGQSYRLLIANTLPDGSLRAIGHLSIHSSAGVGRWLDVQRGGTLDLGVLSTTGAKTAPTLGTKSEGDHSDSESDAEDVDTETHHDDEEHAVCADHHEGGDDRDDDVELTAEHEPGDDWADEHEKEHDDEDEREAPCAKPPPAPPATTSPPASAPPASAPPSAPPGGLGSPCVVTASCATGLACVASRCVVALR